MIRSVVPGGDVMDLNEHSPDSAVVPRYLLEMVRRAPPVTAIIPNSTPVLAFGDPYHAQVATLGINPSGREFIENGVLLSGTKRRLATLKSLDAQETENLTDAQISTVIDECNSYFSPGRNPYRAWFDPLDQVLREGLGVSYYDGSACHLDLVHWATNPVWGKLSDRKAKRLLLDESLPHLRNQLQLGAVRTVLINGRAVLRQVMDVHLAELSQVPATLRVGSVFCSLYVGTRNGVQFAGWSTNLQSSFGVKLEFREQLAHWLSETLGTRTS
jgi:hypothetical protein